MSRIDQKPNVSARPRRFGLLLTFRATAAYLGLSETRLREVRHILDDDDQDVAPRFPMPVRLPGTNPLELYRRTDIDEWVRILSPVERQRAGALAQRGDAA